MNVDNNFSKNKPYQTRRPPSEFGSEKVCHTWCEIAFEFDVVLDELPASSVVQDLSLCGTNAFGAETTPCTTDDVKRVAHQKNHWFERIQVFQPVVVAFDFFERVPVQQHQHQHQHSTRLNRQRRTLSNQGFIVVTNVVGS